LPFKIQEPKQEPEVSQGEPR